jgi:ferritin
MTAKRLAQQLNEQIGYEFAAQQQYIANAVYYDGETLPQLASFFYRQALEERNHAMMMVQYLLDTESPVTIPGVAAPQSEFKNIVEPVQGALDQERRVAQQIDELAKIAREEQDSASEQFLQWFIKEQVEEISSMSDLLRVVTRAADRPLDIENYLAREKIGEGEDPTAPNAAGGAV